MHNNLIEFVVEKIYCIGDIHGNFNAINGLIKQHDIKNSLLVFCGDCGFGFESNAHYTNTIFPKLSKILGKYNDYCVFIAGNHDDHDLFNSFTFNYKRIKTVPDYTIINTFLSSDKAIIHHSILCVGGATSIDRTIRIATNTNNAIMYKKYHDCTLDEAKAFANKCYWENELPMYDEQRLKLLDKEKTPIDIVCTHTAPSFCKPTNTSNIDFWLKIDKNLLKDLNYERNVMDKISDFLSKNSFNVSNWCYGHYHFHNVEYINGVKFILLDMEKHGKLDYECIL